MTIERDIAVQLVCAWPDHYWRKDLELASGASVADALAAAAPALREAGIETAALSVAVFGKSVQSQTRLRDGDRLELLRPLLLSPQEARAARAKAARSSQRK